MPSFASYVRKTVGVIAGSLFPENFYDRLFAWSALRHAFRDVFHVQSVPTREALWDVVVKKLGADTLLAYLEFGVWQGYSIKFFSRKFTNADSSFLGFDSFIGLPEQWNREYSTGAFSERGNIPKIDDPRVHFMPGWFQNTFAQAVDFIKANSGKVLLVHYDADLYSSTLFLLSSLHREADEYFCVFDEFNNHECRALLNYMQSYGAKVEFIAVHRGEYNHQPEQVFAKITTNRGHFVPE
jgi:hypothetical protein